MNTGAESGDEPGREFRGYQPRAYRPQKKPWCGVGQATADFDILFRLSLRRRTGLDLSKSLCAELEPDDSESPIVFQSQIFEWSQRRQVLKLEPEDDPKKAMSDRVLGPQ